MVVGQIESFLFKSDKVHHSYVWINNTRDFHKESAHYASVNSRLPAAPSPPPRVLTFFFALDGKFPGMVTLEL